ncbi:MAG: tyrosine-type recombinase/integrase [Opitutaceae bacterium]|jgi:integrase
MHPEKLPRKIGRAVVRIHKGGYYELDFGRLGGKRKRLYRTTATAAIETAKRVTREIREHGQLAVALTTSQRYEAAVCFDTLREAKVSLRSVVDDWLKAHPAGHMDKTLEVVCAELIAKKKAGNRRERYIQDLTCKFRFFTKHFPKRPISTITTEDIESLVSRQKWVPVSQRTYVQGLNVLFNYGIRRGYCGSNPCLALELPEVDEREPVIMTVEQAEQALNACQGSQEMIECLPYVSIGLFCGIRPTEIERLDWEQVSIAQRTITVLGANAKGRDRRPVEMSNNLAAWLQPVAQDKGPVIPVQVRETRDRVKQALGWKKWPHDILRHSYASYHFAEHKNASSTQYNMGHNNAQVLFSHYKSLVTPEAAKAFWAIYPQKAEQAAA